MSSKGLIPPFMVEPHVTHDFDVTDFKLKSDYPVGMVFNAFVTKVHNVPKLRFFMFALSAANAQQFASVHQAATSSNASKCLRFPREGIVFALRMGESTFLRAVRPRTLCITNMREVFLPDIGCSYALKHRERDMFHLPEKLRNRPGIAVLCQLRGVNDDVTILKMNMRAFIRGLLFRCVQLRVDGYCGDVLKVQLLDVDMDKMLKWNKALGAEEYDLCYALKNTVLNGAEYIESESQQLNCKSPLLDVTETIQSLEKNCLENESSFLSTIYPSEASLSLLPTMNDTDKKASFSEDYLLNRAFMETKSVESIERSFLNSVCHKNSMAEKLVNGIANSTPMGKSNRRPLLGFLPKRKRSINRTCGIRLPVNVWKRDILKALSHIDKRGLRMNYSYQDLLTITPTFIGHLERFFGIIHRRNEYYLQHIWTDEEIPYPSRFTTLNTPYIFDIVLARHSGDGKWYRAKVIEIIKICHKVLVFFVDFGGAEYVNVWNVAYLSQRIAKMPFQAILFRLHDLVDVTTTKAELDFGINFLRNMLLKKTITVRVVINAGDELTICFEDKRFSHVQSTLMRWGLIK